MPTNTVCCESDGLEYLSNPVQLKCKKCGHFWFAKDPVPTCHASPSTMMKVVLDRTEKPPSIIEKEIDLWLTTSRTIDQSEKEANLRAALTRVYEAGFKHGAKHEGSYEVAFKAGHEAGVKARAHDEDTLAKKAYDLGCAAMLEEVWEGLKSMITTDMSDDMVPKQAVSDFMADIKP